MIRPSIIELDSKRLFVDLPNEVVFDLLADILARYEGFFTMNDPVYPAGKPELIFQVLTEGYGLQECGRNVHGDVINLRTANLVPADHVDSQWKELGVGRLLARIFATSLRG